MPPPAPPAEATKVVVSRSVQPFLDDEAAVGGAVEFELGWFLCLWFAGGLRMTIPGIPVVLLVVLLAALVLERLRLVRVGGVEVRSPRCCEDTGSGEMEVGVSTGFHV